MKLLCMPMPLHETVLRKSPGGNPVQRATLTAETCDQPQQHPWRTDPSVSTTQTQNFDNWTTENTVTHCITPVTILKLKYYSAAFLSSTNVTSELAHESSLYIPKHMRPKLEMGMQRECMASDNPVGWKGKEIAGSIVWTDLHSWHVLPFSWQQDPSV